MKKRLIVLSLLAYGLTTNLYANEKIEICGDLISKANICNPAEAKVIPVLLLTKNI